MTVETLVHGTKTMRQRRALEAYVARLEDAFRGQPLDGGSSTVLSIDGVSLPLEPWIVARMNPPDAAPDDGSGRTELVRQSLALWLKISVDLRNLRDGVQNGSENLYELQAELMLDSAFGSSLFRELQDNVDGLVKQGKLAEARRFSKLQRDLRGVVRDMKHSITESNGTPDGEPVAQPADRKPAPPPPMARVLHETDLEEPVPRPRRRPRPKGADPTTLKPSRVRSRTKLLLALNGVALLVCAVLTVPLLKLGRTPRALTLADLPNVAPLIEIQARPPALYATVDGKRWSGFDDKEKRRFVDGIGSVLLTEGYWGLLVKTEDGRLVGNWLARRGTRLIDATPEVAAIAQTATDVAPQYTRFIP